MAERRGNHLDAHLDGLEERGAGWRTHAFCSHACLGSWDSAASVPADAIQPTDTPAHQIARNLPLPHRHTGIPPP